MAAHIPPVLRQTHAQPRRAAWLAVEERVLVIPFYGYRERDLRHRVVIEPPICLYQYYGSGEILPATNRLNGFLERAICSCPDV
jgi:phosphatidylinositol dimannoside acyltransferase